MGTEPLTGTLRETLAQFDPAEPRTTTEVADDLDLGRRSTYNRLERLVDHDRLETKKVGANGRVWWRPPTDAPTSPDWPAAAESLVDDVLDDVEVGMFVLDENFDVAWINEATERYFDLDRTHAVGRDKRGLIDDHLRSVVDDADAFAETVLATYDDNTYTERFECRVTPGDGREERWLEHRSRPIEAGAYAGGRVELYYDVTERKETQLARRDDRQQFESLVSAVDEYAIFTLDPDGYVQTWNPGVERIKGYHEEDFLGEHVSAFYTEEDRAAGVPERNLEAAAERGSVTDEGWRVREDGSRFWATVTISAIRDENGELEGYAKVTRDMTDWREQERHLRRERNLTDQLFETAPVRLVVFEADESVERMNSRARRVLGFDSSDTGSVDSIALRDADGEPLPAQAHPVRRVIETGEPLSGLEVQHETSAGERRWASLNASPLLDEDGEVERVIVAGKDITDRKEKERRLARQRDELKRELDDVFERIDDAFYALDDEMRFEYVNDRAEELLGFRESELLGRTVWEALSIADDDPIRERFRRAMATQEPASFERYSEPLGIWELVRIYPSESGLSVYFTDITERKERERELEDAKSQLEAATEAGAIGTWEWNVPEDEFVAGASFARTFGVEPDAARDGVSLDRFLSAIHADDRERVRRSIDDAVADCGEYREEYRVRSADGEYRWVVARGTVECDEDGEPVTFPGALTDITERKRAERELERRREQLAALNNLNEVVRDATAAVIEQSTREEIEETVCERLAATDSYLFAWTGDVDPATRTVTLRTEAGVDGYLDGITISVDPDDARSEGPTGRALRTGETQVSHDIRTDARHDPWRSHVEQYDVRSSAAIPLAHEGSVYGVLNVYADRPYAFEGRELEVISQLGEVVGHAIAAAERKQALQSDELVELDFQVQDVFAAVEAPTETSGTITLDDMVPIEDEEFLVYGTATRDAVDTVHRLADVLPHWDSVTVVSDDDPVRFELRVIDPPVLSAVASRGGYIDEAIIEDGDYRMTIHLAPSVDVREVTDAVEAAYPQAELLRRHQINRAHDESGRLQRRIVADLTDRQRSALEAAYHAGFFEWPRETTGEQVAESLGIAPPTFHHHLRKAQRKTLDALLSVQNRGATA